MVPWTKPTQQPKWHLDHLIHFSRIHCHYQWLARPTNEQKKCGTRPVPIATSLANAVTWLIILKYALYHRFTGTGILKQILKYLL